MRVLPNTLPLQWRLFARHLAASQRPILCGPFRSEVGFEITYWIPFLHNFRERYGISRDRLVAVGRGGSAAWYDMAGSADLYERMSVEEARTLSVQASQTTGSMKQNQTPAWERQVCALTANGLGITDYHVLSPSWMYGLVAPFWEGRQSLNWLDSYLLQAVKMHAPALDPELAAKLPPKYVAMRWYARPTWPLREDLRLWTRRCVEAIAKQTPVVLVDAGFHTDDHADIALGNIPNVLKLSDLTTMTSLNNLAIQSSVIAKASAYVGTYGGMAQGAMRWGVPTVAFYDQFGQTAPAHLHLTQSLSLRTGVPFIAGRPGDLDQVLALVSAKSGGKMAPRHQVETTAHE